MFLVKILINDVVLFFMKRASDKYSTGSCRSSCCDVIIYKFRPPEGVPPSGGNSKTMESIKSE